MGFEKEIVKRGMVTPKKRAIPPICIFAYLGETIAPFLYAYCPDGEE